MQPYHFFEVLDNGRSYLKDCHIVHSIGRSICQRCCPQRYEDNKVDHPNLQLGCNIYDECRTWHHVNEHACFWVMREDELDNHCCWHHLNEQACLAAMDKDELENYCSWLCLYQWDCSAAKEEDEPENRQSHWQDSQRRRVTTLQEAGHLFQIMLGK